MFFYEFLLRNSSKVKFTQSNLKSPFNLIATVSSTRTLQLHARQIGTIPNNTFPECHANLRPYPAYGKECNIESLIFRSIKYESSNAYRSIITNKDDNHQHQKDTEVQNVLSIMKSNENGVNQ